MPLEAIFKGRAGHTRSPMRQEAAVRFSRIRNTQRLRKNKNKIEKLFFFIFFRWIFDFFLIFHRNFVLKAVLSGRPAIGYHLALEQVLASWPSPRLFIWTQNVAQTLLIDKTNPGARFLHVSSHNSKIYLPPAPKILKIHSQSLISVLTGGHEPSLGQWDLQMISH